MTFQQTQTDSIQAQEQTEGISMMQNRRVEEQPQHPYQVLRKLPADATPAQQDSAIQAVFHVENTHLSTRPDTLGIPGYGKGKSAKDVSLPQYYKVGFFTNDPMYHPELSGRTGIAGDPMPYTIRGDNTLTALLLGCFILMMVALSRSKRFIFRQAKDFLFEPRTNTTEMTETTSEFRIQFFLVMQTCLLLSIIAFLYTQEWVADTFILSSQYQLIQIFFGLFVGYFLLKGLLYWAVNSLFFGSRKSERWLKSMLFLASVEGVALFPQVMVQSYFDVPLQNGMIYTLLILFLVKITTLYKGYLVFFKGKTFVLQIILYFCALEIVPVLSLWGILVMVVDYLKINF